MRADESKGRGEEASPKSDRHKHLPSVLTNTGRPLETKADVLSKKTKNKSHPLQISAYQILVTD